MQENRYERRRQKRLGLAVGTRNVFRRSGNWDHGRSGRDRQMINSAQIRWRLGGAGTEGRMRLIIWGKSLYEESRARRGTLGWRQRQVNNLQPWTSLSGQEQTVCFHSQKYSAAGATENSMLQTLHIPLLPSTTGQAQTSPPPMQGYTADHNSLVMLSGML